MCLPLVMYNVSISGSSEVKSVYSCTGLFCEVRFTAPDLYYDEEGNTQVNLLALLTNQQTTETVSIQISEKFLSDAVATCMSCAGYTLISKCII